MNDQVSRRSISIYLEGGLGDHLLGMRVLPVARRQYPDHDLILYSNSANHQTPMAIAAMSPYAASVVPIYHANFGTSREAECSMAMIEKVRLQDLRLMMSADLFIDGTSGKMLASAALNLNVPIFDILNRCPELIVPKSAVANAAAFLSSYNLDTAFVGLNLSKYGLHVLKRYEALILRMVLRLLEEPRVRVLNMYTTSYDFLHWPEPLRTQRRDWVREESTFCAHLCRLSERVVPCVDLPIATIAALLMRCRYFIGVDNGVKHLAWALAVPHTFFHTHKPDLLGALKYMPDLHRMLIFDSSEHVVAAHVAASVAAVTRPQSSERYHSYGL